MRIPRTLLAILAAGSLSLGACATLAGRDPLQVNVAGIEPLEGQGLELRMLVELRVQNPNDAPVDYDGVYVEMDVQGNRFASGVSDASGSIPRFGESVVSVPVTVSAFNFVRQAIGIVTEGDTKLEYELKGKLAGPAFKSVRFSSRGEMEWPVATTAPE